jgi:hypothetical protein
LAPEWDEHHEFVIDLAHTQDLFVEAWDKDDLSAHDLLATQRVAIWRLAETVGEPTLWPLMVADDYQEQKCKPEVMFASHFHPCTTNAAAATKVGSVGVVTVIVWSISKWPAASPLMIKAELVRKDGNTELGSYSRAALKEDTREGEVDIVKLMGRMAVKEGDWAVQVSVGNDEKAKGAKLQTVWKCDESKLTKDGDLYEEVAVEKLHYTVEPTFHGKHTLRVACRFAAVDEAAEHEPHEWARSTSELLDAAPKLQRRTTLHKSEDLDLD